MPLVTWITPLSGADTCLGPKPYTLGVQDGSWVDVQDAEPAVASASVRQAEAWHQQQWLVAFEVLVSMPLLSPAKHAC